MAFIVLPDKADLGAWVRMSLTPGVGHRAWCRLLGEHGDAQTVFSLPDSSLQIYLSKNQIESLHQLPAGWPEPLEVVWNWCQQASVQEQRVVLTLDDPRYPKPLLELADPPLLLYARGQVDAWLGASGEPPPALAVVGSRNPTPQGLDNARQLAHAAAKAGLCIVSGLALGVDSAAHEGALRQPESAATTVAVVGTGLDRVYPRRNHALAHRIAGRGVLLSEYPLGTPPLAQNFPRRNRLIAALAQGTLVVEAALESGSLITARLALDLGKSVMAVPGSIHSPQSRGCHALLREGACLVESVADIVQELQMESGVTPQKPEDRHPAGHATDDAAGPMLAAMGWEPCTVDQMAQRTEMPVGAVLAELSSLELAGCVARLPGGRYQRLAG